MKRVLIALFVTLVLFIATGGLNNYITVTDNRDFEEEGQVYHLEEVTEVEELGVENINS